MTLLELSTRISQNLNNPDSPTVGVINYYLRNNIGTLNNLINTTFSINSSDGTISPELGDQEGSILQYMYMVYYWSNHVNSSIGAAGYDHVLEVAENGAVIRMVNKSTLASSYIQMKKQEQEELNNLVAMYRSNNATPQSVDGNDDMEQLFHGVSTNINVRTRDMYQ